MKNSTIKMRTFGTAQFHEFKLPNGKELLIDPFWGFPGDDSYYGDGLMGHSPDEIERADYIIITHTHGDHDQALGYFANKYDSKVIAPAMSAQALFRYHKIGCDNIFFAFPGETLKFKDVEIKVFPAKHCNLGMVYDPNVDIGVNMGLTGHKECDDWGSIESYDYLITFYNGFQILLANGRDIYSTTSEYSYKLCPDVLIRQAEVKYEEGEKKDQMYSPEDYAELCSRFRAGLVLPTHYDSVCKKYGGKEWMDNYYAQVNEELQKLVPGTSFFLPDRWKWYSFGLSISED